jgi:hypothetical protein
MPQVRLKIYGCHDRTGAVRKMPRKGARIGRDAGKVTEMTIIFVPHAKTIKRA